MSRYDGKMHLVGEKQGSRARICKDSFYIIFVIWHWLACRDAAITDMMRCSARRIKKKKEDELKE